MNEEHRSPALLLMSAMLLLALSVLMVFSTTAISGTGDGGTLLMLRKHLFQILVGLAVFALVLKIKLKTLKKIAPFLLVLSFLSLAAVLIPGLGTTAGGAQRWFGLGPFRIQPGEIAKFSVVLYLSTYISRQHKRMKELVPGAVIPLAIVALFGVLLLSQPDFGSTVIIFTVVLLQLLLVSNLKHLFALGGIGAIGVVTLVALSPYRFRRFQSFLNPLADPSASGYQLLQSLIAVGSGGLFGQGLGGGKQKLFYLPAAHTDFIYAVIAEELGLAGAAVVLLLFAIVALCGYAAAMRLHEDPFRSSLAVGCTSLIVVPALLNMGVVLGLLPTKGLVLPFVSYGGTAMLINLAILALLVKLVRGETL